VVAGFDLRTGGGIPCTESTHLTAALFLAILTL